MNTEQEKKQRLWEEYLKEHNLGSIRKNKFILEKQKVCEWTYDKLLLNQINEKRNNR